MSVFLLMQRDMTPLEQPIICSKPLMLMPFSRRNWESLSEKFAIVVKFLRKYFSVSKIIYIFAAYSKRNERPKVQKKAEIGKSRAPGRAGATKVITIKLKGK